MPIDLADNLPASSYVFTLCVFTGTRFGAGTSATITVSLICKREHVLRNRSISLELLIADLTSCCSGVRRGERAAHPRKQRLRGVSARRRQLLPAALRTLHRKRAQDPTLAQQRRPTPVLVRAITVTIATVARPSLHISRCALSTGS